MCQDTRVRPIQGDDAVSTAPFLDLSLRFIDSRNNMFAQSDSQRLLSAEEFRHYNRQSRIRRVGCFFSASCASCEAVVLLTAWTARNRRHGLSLARRKLPMFNQTPRCSEPHHQHLYRRVARRPYRACDLRSVWPPL